MPKKDKKKKDPKAKEAKRLKQEAKAARSAQKKSAKQAVQDGDSGGREGADAGGASAALGSLSRPTPEKAKDVAKMLKDMARKGVDADNTPVVEEDCGQPSPRTNFSFVPYPAAEELLLFGGEYHDGKNSECTNELYRWNIARGTWRRVTSAGAPPPRCSHQAVVYRDDMYVLGGEFATVDQFHHYRDFWRLDLKTNRWSVIEAPGTSPSPRSGHRMCVWRNFLVVFGGFYETYRETKWFNDIFIYSFAERNWRKVLLPPLAPAPSPRSGCQLALHVPTDTIFALGGYAKVKAGGNSESGRSMTDIWALHMAPVAKGHDPTWQKISKKGAAPCPRSGTTLAVYKNRAVAFGGVVDHEGRGMAMSSTFYNDLHAYDLDRRRWYELHFRKAKKAGAKGKKRKKKAGAAMDAGGSHAAGDIEPQSDGGSGSDAETKAQAEADSDNAADDDDAGGNGNKFAYIVDGEIVYMTASDDEDEEDGGTEATASTGSAAAEDAAAAVATAATTPPLPPGDAADEESKDAAGEAPPAAAVVAAAAEDAAAAAAAAVASADADADADADAVAADNTAGDEAAAAELDPTPIARFGAPLAVLGHQIFMYGGIVEMGRHQQREVTLDDCWSLDLRQLQRWECVLEGTWTQQQWQGDDDSSSDESEEDDYDFSSSEEDDEDEGEDEGEGEDDEDGAVVAAAAGPATSDADEDESTEKEKKSKKKKKDKDKDKKKKSKKKGGSKALREEIAALREALDLADEQQTPKAGEKLRDFFARTSAFWGSQAAVALQQQATATADAGGSASTEVHSEKELRALGFKLASDRFEVLKPKLDRLNELEEQQKQAEEGPKRKKESSGSSSSKSKSGSRSGR